MKKKKNMGIVNILIPVLVVVLLVVGGAGFYLGKSSEKVSSGEESKNTVEKIVDTVNNKLGNGFGSSASKIYEGSYGNAVITTDNNYRYIKSDGIPEHDTGQFPNTGNPNTISEQDHSYKVAINPVYSSEVAKVQLAGVALNGIPLEPGTAETYNGDINWSIEAFDAEGMAGLGIDWSNAHVQPNGTYHYHATPEGLLVDALKDQSGDLIQLAWAPDGFPIFYSQGNRYESSWRVKKGVRPSGPGGAYDGTYTQDYEYVEGLGDLDECNGKEVGGSYVYFFTDSFPYIQRCVHGTPDSSFERFGGGMPPGGQQEGQQGGIKPQKSVPPPIR